MNRKREKRGRQYPWVRSFRVNDSEDELILRRAAERGLNVSDFLRAVVLAEAQSEPDTSSD